MPKLPQVSGVDTEIEAALSARDKRRVLTLLMVRFGDAVYKYAVAMTRDRDLADEVRQQVFVDAYRDLDNVAVPAALPRWIFGIARHRCLDAVDAQLRWNQRYKNDPPEDLEQDDCEPDLDRCRMAHLLAACLTELAPAARDAVILRYQQELSYDEAAAIAGDLPGTLQRRVARALPMLRKCVEAKLQLGESR